LRSVSWYAPRTRNTQCDRSWLDRRPPDKYSGRVVTPCHFDIARIEVKDVSVIDCGRGRTLDEAGVDSFRCEFSVYIRNCCWQRFARGSRDTHLRVQVMVIPKKVINHRTDFTFRNPQCSGRSLFNPEINFVGANKRLWTIRPTQHFIPATPFRSIPFAKATLPATTDNTRGDSIPSTLIPRQPRRSNN